VFSIEIKQVDFRYPGTTVAALHSINCSFPVGKVIGLIGPSASGKSTLGRLIKGLIEPTTGEIYFVNPDGERKKTNRSEHLKTVGWACAHPEVQLFAPTVWEEIAFAPSNQGLRDKYLETRVQWAMQQVGLDYDYFRDKHPLFLSGGERRRVALAGVVAMDCRWYIFDEPTTGLDYAGCRNVIKMVKSLAKKGCGVCWITHDTSLVRSIADLIWEIEDGELSIKYQVTTNN